MEHKAFFIRFLKGPCNSKEHVLSIFKYRGHHSEKDVSFLLVNDSPWWSNLRWNNIYRTEKQEFL